MMLQQDLSGTDRCIGLPESSLIRVILSTDSSARKNKSEKHKSAGDFSLFFLYVIVHSVQFLLIGVTAPQNIG